MSDKFFVDSNLWLYAFILRPGEEDKHQRAAALIEASDRYSISTQMVAEVSSRLRWKDVAQFCTPKICNTAKSSMAGSPS